MSDRLSSQERAMLDALQAADTPDEVSRARAKRRLFTELGLLAAGTAAASTAAVNTAAVNTAAVNTAAVNTAAVNTAGGSSVAATALGGTPSALGAASTAAATGTGAKAAASSIAASATKMGLLWGAGKVGVTQVALVVTAAVAGVGGATWWSQHQKATHVSPRMAATAVAPGAAAPPRAAFDSAPHEKDGPEGHGAPAIDPAVNEGEPHTNLEGALVPPIASIAPDGNRPSTLSAGSARRPVSAARGSLEEEAQILARAHGLIRSGAPGAAIPVLLEHQKRFPRGALGLERQATLAVARCLSGQAKRGRAEAAEFKRKHPNSPMVQRLESACRITAE